MGTAGFSLLVGWVAMLLGVVAGAVLGMYFHAEDWAGGYGSYRRRMMRLGHISLFGLGFVNLLFGLTLGTISLHPAAATVAAAALLLGVVTMPACCFLAAWRKPYRHLFPVPVLSVLVGIVSVLWGWSS